VISILVCKSQIERRLIDQSLLGKHITSNEEVAIKLESIRTKHPQLHIESKIYRLLSGGVGIPSTRWFGVEGEYNVLVMDRLGPSLEDLFNFCGKKFSLKTVLLLANQMVGVFCFLASLSVRSRSRLIDSFEQMNHIYTSSRLIVSVSCIQRISFIETSNLVK
jgi:hypothetical protein